MKLKLNTKGIKNVLRLLNEEVPQAHMAVKRSMVTLSQAASDSSNIISLLLKENRALKRELRKARKQLNGCILPNYDRD